jgi:hypothetical protein
MLNMFKHTLISVEKADPLPTWLPNGDWHRYIIRQGNSDLEGYIIGSLAVATKYAESVAANLNERSINGKSIYAVNKKNPPESPPITDKA